MRLTFILLSLTMCFFHLLAYGEKGKKLLFEDINYEDNIKTVVLYNSDAINGRTTSQAIAPMHSQGLILEFDDLTEDADTYNAEIIHCNANWTKSMLNNFDFIAEFNEFPINDFDFSFDTRTLYVHYVLSLPRLKLPGNYLLKVYRESDKDDLILTRRFMIYDNRVTLTDLSNQSGNALFSGERQRIDFIIDYENYSLDNPLRTTTVTMRQNRRWDNAITGIKPTFPRESQKKLEYKFFEPKYIFKGGNEYRFFDLRSLRHPGQNVGAVNIKAMPVQAFLMMDKPRNYQKYSQYIDNNGNFTIDNQDNIGNERIESDYVDVQFILDTPPVAGDIYIIGAMTDWRIDEKNKLVFDETTDKYKANLLLKQGFYDYQYLAKGDTINQNYFEGNHFETENEYEILVYYRPINLLADLLIGYFNLTKNSR